MALILGHNEGRRDQFVIEAAETGFLLLEAARTLERLQGRHGGHERLPHRHKDVENRPQMFPGRLLR